MSRDLWILDGARTPMRRFLGDFARTSAIDLCAVATREAVQRSGVAPRHIEHVVVGNALQTSTDALYGARHVALNADLPETIPAVTVNRLCGSGIQAIISIAQLVLTEEIDCGVAAGMENMTMAPHVVYGAREGFRMRAAEMKDSLIESLMDPYCGCTMSMTSDNLARKYGITREQQDEFALRSQQRAHAAQQSGRLAEEIVPVEIKKRGETISIDVDDHLRPETTLEGLAKLPTAFGQESFVSAGNASGMVDGAAALVVAEAGWAREHGCQGLGRIISWATVGVEPSIMGIGPVPATQLALKRAGWQLDAVDVIEVNEAFAGQYLAVERELGLDRDKVNVNGGAIALGHPLGATGTRITYSALRELRHRGGGKAVATACIGGGQGIAICIQVD